MKTTKELVDSYGDWYHEFDFGGGVKSAPKFPHHRIWAASERFLEPVDFRGKTVLEIGCWDGYWSFLAERRGAARVLATDCNSQRWGATRGFEIAHQIYGSRVEYRGNVDIYELEKLGERFDIVICFGVFYHLTHIMTGFTQLRHTVNPGGLVLLEGAAIDDTESPHLEFLYGPRGDQPERQDPSNWVVPTRRCLWEMLAANYFDISREEFPHPLKRGRILVEAKPVVRQDGNHLYPPPFGLAQYDVRWKPGAPPA